MPRKLTLVAGVAMLLSIGAPARGQDPPSLGDLARQAQQDKEKNKPAKAVSKVLTNEDLGSGSSAGSAPERKSGADLTPAEKIAKAEQGIDQIESLDRATLVRNALQGKDVDFPGRARWEERLIAARLDYVTRVRAVIQDAKQIIASADSLKGHQDPNDPRVKEMTAKFQILMRNAVQADSGIQAVIMEGRDLAAQAPAH